VEKKKAPEKMDTPCWDRGGQTRGDQREERGGSGRELKGDGEPPGGL